MSIGFWLLYLVEEDDERSGSDRSMKYCGNSFELIRFLLPYT